MFLKPYQYACVQPSVETILSGVTNKAYLKGGFSSSDPTSCVVVCIALGVEMSLEGVPARPYIVWGTELHGKS